MRFFPLYDKFYLRNGELKMGNQKTWGCDVDTDTRIQNKEYTSELANKISTLIFLDSGLLEEKQNINNLPKEKKEELSRYKSYLMLLPWYEKIENRVLFLTEEDYNTCHHTYQLLSESISLFYMIAVMHQNRTIQNAWSSNLSEKINQLEQELESYLDYARPVSFETDKSISTKTFWILKKSLMEHRSYEEYLTELTLCLMEPPIALKRNKGCE